MAELYGKATGCCRGKGGSMHLGDPAVGMLPAIAIVAGGNSVVSGIGLAIKLRGDDRVAVCFFGEGATNEGAFHEGLNFAAVKKLPIVFACENNLYGASTSFSAVSLVEDVAARGERLRRTRAASSMAWTSSRCARPPPRPSRLPEAERVRRCSSSRPTASPATAEATRADTAARRRSGPGRSATR